MKKYIVLHSNCEKDLRLLSDLRKLQNVEFEEAKIINNKTIFTKIVQKIHCSHKINSIVKLPFRNLWYKFNYYNFDDRVEYYCLVYGDVFFPYDISLFKKLKKKNKNLHFILILVDSLNVKTQVADLVSRVYKDKIWDYVFSYDYEDCKKYNMNFLNYEYYSKPEVLNENLSSKYDVYFCGTLKPGRKEKIIELFEQLDKNKIKCNFKVVRYLKETTEFIKEGFCFLDNKQDYSECIKDIQNTKCIIEYMQEGQKSQSLRYFEAVCFNRKLLTNNPNISRLPFYNDKYMKYFEKPEDIDMEWLKEELNVDYKYKDEFSPIHFIERLESLYNLKEDK